jgi:hypothetical protein
MMINYTLIHNNSFDLLSDLVLIFYSKDIITILPVLILCGVVSSISYIFFASNLGQKIIKNAGKIGSGLVLGVTGLESALNLVDRAKGSGKSSNSGGSDNKDKNGDDKNKNGNKK